MTTPYLELFTTKRDRCRALLELSKRQSRLIAQDDYTELLDVLHRKQSLLADMDTLKAEHAAALARWRVERDTLDARSRADCDALLGETESLIARLVETERTCTESLSSRRDATRSELQTVSTGSNVNDAYRDSLATSTHRHLDLDT